MSVTVEIVDNPPRVSSKIFKKLFFFILFLGGMLLSFVFITPLNKLIGRITWFHIAEISVKAPSPLNEKLLQRRLKYLRGESLLTLDSDKLASKVKENPWVKEVIIQKQLPNHIELLLSAKEPKALFMKKGRAYYMDVEGDLIAALGSNRRAASDLPVVSIQRTKEGVQWERPEVLRLLFQLSKSLGPVYQVSELVMEPYPYFSVYLQNRNAKISFHFDNWATQISKLNPLLAKIPSQSMGKVHISLLFPKKAIVSTPLSN